jgi:hypothetical protein
MVCWLRVLCPPPPFSVERRWLCIAFHLPSADPRSSAAHRQHPRSWSGEWRRGAREKAHHGEIRLHRIRSEASCNKRRRRRGEASTSRPSAERWQGILPAAVPTLHPSLWLCSAPHAGGPLSSWLLYSVRTSVAELCPGAPGESR